MRWLSILLVLSIAGPAFSSDGQLEINQACAAGPGCFAGDGPGLPVTIGASGSYRLTSNLTVPNPATTAISVVADNVAVDLGGFSILGPNSCSSNGCSASGSGGGIVGSNAQGVSVSNGTIQGMGANGIELGFAARVERVLVRSNGIVGIFAGPASVVLANRVIDNGNGGMLLDRECVYADNVIVTDGLGASVAFASGVATATGGNVCDDKLCSGRGERRYYLTKTAYLGNQPRSACTTGYHMASMFEIMDPTVLVYDRSLGASNGLSGFGDLGDGPPSGLVGWVRTGAPQFTATIPGVANCEAFTTSTTSGGTSASLKTSWDVPRPGPQPFDAWDVGVSLCSIAIPVWCVQD